MKPGRGHGHTPMLVMSEPDCALRSRILRTSQADRDLSKLQNIRVPGAIQIRGRQLGQRTELNTCGLHMATTLHCKCMLPQPHDDDGSHVLPQSAHTALHCTTPRRRCGGSGYQ